MSHDHSRAYEIGEAGAENLTALYNSKAAQDLGRLVKSTFNKVTGLLGKGVDIGTGFFSEYIGEDWGKVAATVLSLGTAGYLASGKGPIFGLALMGVAAGAIYHSSDNIHKESTVGQAIDFLTEDFVELYNDYRPANVVFNPPTP